MKKFYFLATSLLLSLTSVAQRPNVEKVVEGVDNLVITSKNNTMTVISDANGNDNVMIYQVTTGDSNSPSWQFDCPFVDQKPSGNASCSKYVTAIKDLYWGWDFNYDKKNGVRNCFEVGVGQVIGLSCSPIKNGPDFSIGLGFGMRRLLVKDGYRFDLIDNNLILSPVPANEKVDLSRVDSWTFHVPVMITQKIVKRLSIGVGAWLNFNTYMKGVTQIVEDDVRYKTYYKGFNQRFFTVDLVGVIGIKDGIGVYGRWCPMTMFTDGRGPEFKTASLGVMLNF